MTDRYARAAERLTQAVLLPRFVRALKGGELAPGDNPGLLADLWEMVQHDPHYEELSRGLLEEPSRAETVFSALWPGIKSRLPSRGHHHLAVWYTRAGWDAFAHKEANQTRRYWKDAQDHFAHILKDDTLLDEFTRSVGVSWQAPETRERLAEWILDPHGEVLVEAIESRNFQASDLLEPHWKVLQRASQRDAEEGASWAKPLAAAARGWKMRLVDEVQEALNAMSEGIEPTSNSLEEMKAPFALLTGFMSFAGRHESLSVWGLERAVEWIWPLYKTKQDDLIQPLLDITRPFASHVEFLLKSQKGAFGRQSLCADYLLFVADYVPMEEEEAHFRRALELCPGHRNARLMLSYHLLRRAHQELVKCENIPVLGITNDPQIKAWHKAKRWIDEAVQTFPANDKLEDYQERLEKARKRLKIEP